VIITSTNPFDLGANVLSSGVRRINVVDKTVEVLFRMSQPDIFYINDFLSHEECDKIVQFSSIAGLKKSKVQTKQGSKLSDVRKSEQVFIDSGKCDIIDMINRRVSSLVSWPTTHTEKIQVLKYEVCGKYEPHYDYFIGTHEEVKQTYGVAGNRIGTLILYLSDVEEGGETVFPNVYISVTPLKGAAVFFRYPTQSPEEKTLHGGSPVVKGTKWIATKWFREGQLYDS